MIIGISYYIKKVEYDLNLYKKIYSSNSNLGFGHDNKNHNF